MHLVGRLLNGPAFSVAIRDSFIYAGTGGGLFVFSAETPGQPQLRGHLYLPHYAFDLTADGGTVYVACWLGGVLAVDVSDPAKPTLQGRYLLPSSIASPTAGAYDLYLADSLLYVAYGDLGFRLLDVKDPTHLREIGSLMTGRTVFGLTFINGFILLAEAEASGKGRLTAVDVSDPASPREVTGVALPVWATDVVTLDNQAYVNSANFLLSTGRVYRVELFLPDSMALRQESALLPGRATKITTDGALLYAGRRGGGVRILNPLNFSLIGSYTSPGRTYGLALWDSVLALADGEEGLALLNVADPAHPVKMAGFDTGDWTYELALRDSLLYIAYLNAGLLIVDISHPEAPRILGAVDTPGQTYGVYLAGRYALLADGPGGLAVAEVTNPAQPQLLGGLELEGTAFSVTGRDSVAYVSIVSDLARPEGYLAVVDIRNPTQPQLRDTVDAAGRVWQASHSNGQLFLAIDTTPASWLARYQGKMGIMDLSNPYGPEWLSQTPIDGGVKSVVVKDRYAILGLVTGTRARSGGRIEVWDVSDPGAPLRVLGVETGGTHSGGVMGLSLAENFLIASVWHPESQEVQVYDLSFLPDSLPRVAYYGADLQPWHAVSDGRYVFVSNMDFSLFVLKLEVPAEVTEPETPGLPPATVQLLPNYPNPFNTGTTLVFELSTPAQVNLHIYNIQGQRVRTLVVGRRPAGRHSVRWDGRDDAGCPLSAGVYFGRLQVGGLTLTQKLLLLR